ncbi:hypothetical protein HUT18_33075 [Streptomyces sp. NA04227]|uniref:hypothetical protein n=1 Tax=Streptomyces sp. NA04227 TaxID=2742136 RepID=UPI0015900171|nr:hypothetical protein [Streptomyces sp. NA04227]QKW10534.1 hypothetical protein HUT18_33075 [Streptomyces sp. NA04227]
MSDRSDIVVAASCPPLTRRGLLGERGTPGEGQILGDPVDCAGLGAFPVADDPNCAQVYVQLPGRSALIRALTAPRQGMGKYSADSAAFLVDELCDDVRRATAALQRAALERGVRTDGASPGRFLTDVIDLIDPDAMVHEIG